MKKAIIGSLLAILGYRVHETLLTLRRKGTNPPIGMKSDAGKETIDDRLAEIDRIRARPRAKAGP